MVSAIQTKNDEICRDSCCGSQVKATNECPRCHQEGKGVLAKTVEHLLLGEAKKGLSCFDGFFYCNTPSCEVVYFRDKKILTQNDLSIVVGLKEGAKPATVCYCFDWSKERIREDLLRKGETIALEDIKEKMKNYGCSCEMLNPSGECCLGDISKAIKDIQKDIGISNVLESIKRS